jgi:DNA-directed RNA polymerase subunit RPC12/RpoP
MARVIEFSKELERIELCMHCGAKIGYFPIDIKQETYVCEIDGEEKYHYVECPNCKHKIII